MTRPHQRLGARRDTAIVAVTIARPTASSSAAKLEQRPARMHASEKVAADGSPGLDN
jgi:hypothetical protein